MFRFALVVCARWESEHLPEWLQYHRAIGFDHVYLYCNDDQPDEMFEATRDFHGDQDPFVTFRFWPGQGEQRAMYLDFLRRDLGQCEWLMFLDVDEFLCLRGCDSLSAFVEAMPADGDAIFFNWLMFGTSGHIERPHGSVLESYTRRSPSLHPFTKVLMRSDSIPRDVPEAQLPRGFWHNWQGVANNPINVIGHPMLHYYDDFPRAAEEYLRQPLVTERIISRATVSHFFMKSEQDVYRRMKRGLRDAFVDQEMWQKKFEAGELDALFADTNAIEDTYLRDFWRHLQTGNRAR